MYWEFSPCIPILRDLILSKMFSGLKRLMDISIGILPDVVRLYHLYKVPTFTKGNLSLLGFPRFFTELNRLDGCLKIKWNPLSRDLWLWEEEEVYLSFLELGTLKLFVFPFPWLLNAWVCVDLYWMWLPQSFMKNVIRAWSRRQECQVRFSNSFSPRSKSLNLEPLDVASPDLTNACHVPGRKKMLRTCWGEVTSRNCELE